MRSAYWFIAGVVAFLVGWNFLVVDPQMIENTELIPLGDGETSIWDEMQSSWLSDSQFESQLMVSLVEASGKAQMLDDCRLESSPMILFVPSNERLREAIAQSGTTLEDLLGDELSAAQFVDVYLVEGSTWQLTDVGPLLASYVSRGGVEIEVAEAADQSSVEPSRQSGISINGNPMIVGRQTCNGSLIAFDGVLENVAPQQTIDVASAGSVFAGWETQRTKTSSRTAIFGLNLTGCGGDLGLCTGNEVTDLSVEDLVVQGTAPGCSLALDNYPDVSYSRRSVLVRCGGPGTVQLVLKQNSIEYQGAFGPSTDEISPTLEIVDQPILKVQIARFAMAENGNVVSNPPGINCGTTNTQCEASFPRGQRVTLSATPGARNVFQGWSGSCSGRGTCLLTMRDDTNVTATFMHGQPLSVTKVGTGTGTVLSHPGVLNCGSICSVFNLDQVTLTARADRRSRFVGWYGEGCSGTGTCVLSQGSGSVFAVFDRR
jgi:hypothetical protein